VLWRRRSVCDQNLPSVSGRWRGKPEEAEMPNLYKPWQLCNEKVGPPDCQFLDRMCGQSTCRLLCSRKSKKEEAAESIKGNQSIDNPRMRQYTVPLSANAKKQKRTEALRAFSAFLHRVGWAGEFQYRKPILTSLSKYHEQC